MKNAHAVLAPMRDTASSRSNVIRGKRFHRHSSHTVVRRTRPATCAMNGRTVLVADRLNRASAVDAATPARRLRRRSGTPG